MKILDFMEDLDLEIKRETGMLERLTVSLASAPKGFLNIKERKQGRSYYQEIDVQRGGRRYRKQININNDNRTIVLLMQKKFQKVQLSHCQQNLRYLMKVKENYLTLEIDEISADMSAKYQSVLKQRKEKLIREKMTAPYPKCPYDARYHIHETDYGELVRSKSEQILANSLYAYGIPFHYEEQFIYAIGEGGDIFPDFTILLPDGSIIIWEHFGILSKKDYCLRSAKKLNIFQLNGLVLGANLILTMDDNKGNFSSGIINRIIKEQLLPYYDGIDLEQKNIIAGMRPQE